MVLISLVIPQKIYRLKLTFFLEEIQIQVCHLQIYYQICVDYQRLVLGEAVYQNVVDYTVVEEECLIVCQNLFVSDRNYHFPMNWSCLFFAVHM